MDDLIEVKVRVEEDDPRCDEDHDGHYCVLRWAWHSRWHLTVIDGKPFEWQT